MVEPERALSGEGRGVRRSLVGQSILVAAVCLAVDVVAFVVRGPGVHTVPELVLLLLIVVVDAALALPSRFSGWVALAHAVATIGLLGGDYAGRLIAGYRAGAWLRGWSAPASLAALAGGIVASRVLAGSTNWVGVGLTVGSNALLPWLVGRYTTARRAYIDELRHRREVAARDAAAEVDLAVARERTAIARDLHDVITHHVSAIGMHAGAARMTLHTKGNGAPVVDTLAAVEAASRAAMTDLRTMLDLLHGGADSTAPPGLGNLAELLGNLRTSGLAARLSVHGAARPLPDSVDVALYRMSQEMLTNALRHGDGTPVDVELDYRDDAVTLAVRNGIGTGAAAPGAGRGLAGIRTRVAMLHGSVRHGPGDDGARWETTVTVPLEPVAEGAS